MKPTKIVILRWDGRITTTSGSAHPDAAARILDYAVNAEDAAVGETETVWIAHGELDVEPYEMAREDADSLIRMLMDADKEAHQAGEEGR
ncbi:hypothetical protein ACIBQX_11590 [Nonomuraea sp. NPDC049714]|uniref:hypothetical protein n=1 Tax=Nonomuraea sp. NPDC049714 TaxID=3364357 RepID=UPI0037B0C0C2